MTIQSEQRYSNSEEIINAVTHGLGVVLGIVVLAILVTGSALAGETGKVLSFAVYGGSIIALFAASTLYHGIRKPAWKSGLQRLDHSAIFLLIAGTYTPFCIVALKGAWGWTLFGIQWGLAALGIALTLLQVPAFKKLEVVFYIAMGWMALIAVKPLIEVVPFGMSVWIVAGGVAYTAGVVFYKWKKLPFNHAVWHLFVLAGAGLHFVGILLYLAPPSIAE